MKILKILQLIWKLIHYERKIVKGVVDRVEDGIAVIQMFKGWEIEIPIRNLPSGIKEGDVVKITFTIDKKATALRRDRIKKMQKRLACRPTREKR